MSKSNRFVAFLMVLCMMLTMFGGTPEKEVYAGEVQAVTMQEKLDYLLERLPKDSDGEIYFTVDQKNCEPTRESGHGCENCNNVEITKTKWFKDLFGEIDATCYPKHWYSDTGWNYNGNSCFGFACFCQWYLYVDNREENLTGEKVATIKFNKEDVQAYARPGDVLRIVNPKTPYGHSVVVYSVEADGVWVVDSNWNRGSDLNCKVYKHFISYTLDYAKGRTTYVCRPSKATQMESGMAGLFDMESYVKTEPTVLKYGDSGQQVQYFQQNLNFLGYSVGTADGEYGNLTKTAVSNLQTALQMDQTGTVKEGLYDLVYGVISEVQAYLKAKGYYSSNIDGISGSGTQTAMKKLQKEWGSEQTGVLSVSILKQILSYASGQISMGNINEYVSRMEGKVVPTPTATPVPAATPSPTATPVPTATPSPTATPNPTATQKPSATATPKPTATVKTKPTATNVVQGIRVKWTAVEGVSKYGVWRSETGKNGTYKWLGNPGQNSYLDEAVTSGKTYFYKVTCMVPGTNTHGEKSEAGGVVFVDTPDFTQRYNKAAGIVLEWNKVDGATGYGIYRKSYAGIDDWVRIATVSGNNTFKYTDTTVQNANGSVYRYTVRALADANMKTLSGCRATGRTMVRLTSRTLNSATATASDSVKCTWATTAQATGYEVRFMEGSTVFKIFTVGNYKTGVKTFTGLIPETTYRVQVRSYKTVAGVGSFYSAWSGAKTVTTPKLIVTPSPII